MYARGVKQTFANEMMKESVTSFMINNFDLKHGMLMSFKLHLSENQVLHVGIFPDKETADKFAQAVKPAQKQIAEMGAKSELMAGPLKDLKIAGDVTIDQLTAASSRA
jgi:hypothetical protein